MRKAFSEVKKINARRGADVLLEILCSEGVEYIFGNPGTTELPLMDALLRTPDLRYVLALQEATAVAMADGYAQAARRPGFLNLHTAGGLGHGMGNLLNASVSQTPLVVTAGQQDSRHTVTDPLLFGELVRIAEPPPSSGRVRLQARINCPFWCGAPFMTQAQLRPVRCSCRCRWMSWRR
jgi:benzoylformate decarboxylase